MIHHLSLGLTVVLCAAPLCAQTASFTPIGTPCTAPREPTPMIGARGLPRIGTSFDVTYTGPNRAAFSAQQSVQPFLITGLSFFPNPILVPTSTFFSQPAGCIVYVQPDIVMAMPLDTTGQSFEAAVTLAIPNNGALIGATWNHQWFAIFTQCGIAGCNPMWAITSDAAIVQVGI